METDKFCLRWNDFETNISSAFRELRDDKDFFDVTLACDDEQIQVHKVILSACSPFFRNILRRNPHQHPLLYLKGVKFSDLQSVLHFMYNGEVNVAQQDLNSFLAVSADLKIKGLSENQTSASAASKLTSTSTSCPPLQRSAPRTLNRDQALPLKRSHPAAPSIPSSRNSSTNDIEIQEIVPVKSEPGDPPHLPSHHHRYEPEIDDQPSHNLTTEDDQALSYQEDDFQYKDEQGGYEGPMVVGLGAEGNKGPMDPIDMDSLISDTGAGTMCLLCHKVLAYRHDARRHIRMKHSGDNTGVTCKLCGTKSKHRWSHAEHMRQKHGQQKHGQAKNSTLI